MKILISAAETSSDAHGAELLRALRAIDPSIEAFGIGGPKLQAVGLRSIVDARELLSMGFFEIFARLPRILRALRRLRKEAAREKPDIAVVIDYPDFHFKLATRLKRLGIPVVYYIPPKVWAWRKSRVKFLRRFFVKLLCIFPFEEEFYRREEVNARYVGNPLMDELPLGLDQAEARRKLGLGPERVLVAMPGSRPSEIKRHLELFLDSIVAFQLRAEGSWQALMPFPENGDLGPIRKRIAEWERAKSRRIKLRLSQGDSPLCMLAADVGVIKSGTSTLEAGVLGCPHVIVYKPNGFSCFVFKHLIRYRGPVGLVNLVAGSHERPDRPYVAEELLCKQATVSSICT